MLFFISQSVLLFGAWRQSLHALPLTRTHWSINLWAATLFTSSFYFLCSGHSASTENAFSNDKVINTVLNINDSHTADVLNNFNVSRDEILRRISSAGQPAAATNDSVATIADDQQQQQQPAHDDNEANAADIEQREWVPQSSICLLDLLFLLEVLLVFCPWYVVRFYVQTYYLCEYGCTRNRREGYGRTRFAAWFRVYVGTLRNGKTIKQCLLSAWAELQKIASHRQHQQRQQ